MDAQELDRLMRAANISQRGLARLVRFDHAGLSRMRNGKRPIPDDLAERVNAALKPKLRENLQRISEAL